MHWVSIAGFLHFSILFLLESLNELYSRSCSPVSRRGRIVQTLERGDIAHIANPLIVYKDLGGVSGWGKEIWGKKLWEN